MASSPTTASALLSAIVFFVGYRTLEVWGAEPFWIGFVRLLCWGCLIMVLLGLLRQVRLWHLIRLALRPTGLHGRTRLPTVGAGSDQNLSFSNKDGNGVPLGICDGEILYWRGKSHASVRAPTEAGKTESFAANVCFALGAHRNLVTTAKGPELALLTTPYRRDVLGQTVISIDPWRMLAGSGLESFDLNPCFNLIKLAEEESPEIFDQARGIVHGLNPETNKGGDNAIFRSMGNDFLVACFAFTAVSEAETGEMVCNFAHVGRMCSGSLEEVEDFLHEMSHCPAYDGEIARMGRRFLSKIKTIPKFAESFITEASDALKIFVTGPLAKSIEYTNFDPTALKRPGQGITIHVVIPPEKLITHGIYGGLVLNALAMLCIRAGEFEPRVTMLCDEFESLCNGGSLPFVMPTLKVGRSLGLQLITLVQDTQGYKSCFGDDASAFTTQSEIVMAWGVRSFEDAESYSKRIGAKSVMTETGSVPMKNDDQASLSMGLNEVGVPIYRPEELMQLPQFSALMFHQNEPGRIIELLSYRSVEPWVSMAGKVLGAPPKTKMRVRFKV